MHWWFVARRIAEQRAGLTVETCSHYNTLLMPVVVLRRGLARLAGAEFRPDDDMPPPWLNRALARVIAAERHLLRQLSLRVGAPIRCIARRG